MENKFKVGDRVKCNDGGYSFCPCYGTIVEFVPPLLYRVKVDGNECRVCADGCWNFWTYELTPVASTDENIKKPNSIKIVITTDGKTTTARLYDGNKVIQKAEANCSTDDEFDFRIGAKLAMDRLMEIHEQKTEEKKTDEKPKPTYFSGKVVCVSKDSPCYAYTVGKVYEFKDGRAVIDNGHFVPLYKEALCRTLDEINENEHICAKFIPFVE